MAKFLRGIPAFFIVTSLVAIGQLSAQSLSGQYILPLDPGQFNFQALSPAPSQTGPGQIFNGGPSSLSYLTVNRWTNGTFTVNAPSRVQNVSQSNTYSNGNTSSFTIEGGEIVVVGGSTANTQTVSTQTSSLVENSMTYKMDNNLLSVVIEYTDANGIKRAQEISLGYFLEDGSFVSFTSGHLTNKQVVADIWETDSNTTNLAPARRKLLGNNYEYGSAGLGAPVTAQVLVGYWVTTTRQGNQIISITVDPVYETRVVNFTKYTNPYRNAAQGTVLP